MSSEWDKLLRDLREEEASKSPEYDADWYKFRKDEEASEEETEYKPISPEERKRQWKREYGRLLRDLESQRKRDVITEKEYARRKADYKRGLQERRGM